jgi:hypothetical protein
MKFSSMRSAIVIASVVAGSVIPSQAFAQTDFHKDLGGRTSYNGLWTSAYTFNKSMILNSIGFYTNGMSFGDAGNETSYSLGTGGPISLTPSSIVDSDGFQWYEFSGGMTITEGTTLRIRTNRGETPFRNTTQSYNFTNDVIAYGGASPAGLSLNLGWTNSNIRVSNPGSNVAPEPGTFSLALTGGAALIGVCIRRRRNAA